VRTVRAGEGPPLRELRLRALGDAPRAFASTVADEAAFAESHWAELAGAGVVQIAVADAAWIGMACARWFDQERAIVQLWGMWVDPEWRGRRVGERLVGAVRGWAVAHGGRVVRLGVIDDGPHAAPFYERLGFACTGETRSLVRDPSLGCFFLARPA